MTIPAGVGLAVGLAGWLATQLMKVIDCGSSRFTWMRTELIRSPRTSVVTVPRMRWMPAAMVRSLRAA